MKVPPSMRTIPEVRSVVAEVAGTSGVGQLVWVLMPLVCAMRSPRASLGVAIYAMKVRKVDPNSVSPTAAIYVKDKIARSAKRSM